MTLLAWLREAYDANLGLTLRAPVVLRLDSGMAASRAFGLRPDTRLPIEFSGVRFFLSGVKRPGQPWDLRLRGRIEPAP